MKFNVLDMSCGHCKASITSAINMLDADATIEFDLDQKTVVVESRRSEGDISDALDRIGFGSTVVAN